jgi:hypothetical protein
MEKLTRGGNVGNRFEQYKTRHSALNLKRQYKEGARFVVFAGPKNSEETFTAIGSSKPRRGDVLAFRKHIAKTFNTSVRNIQAKWYPIHESGAVVVPCSMVHELTDGTGAIS